MIYEYKEKSTNYLNRDLLWEIKQINDELIVPISLDILAILKESLTSSYNTQLYNRVIYLVAFTFGLNIIFLILCYPFLQSMSTFVENSRKMLAVVPIDGLITCKGFYRLVLKRLKK